MLIVTSTLYEQIKNVLDAEELLMKTVAAVNIDEDEVVEFVIDILHSLLYVAHGVEFLSVYYGKDGEVYVIQDDENETHHVVKVNHQAALFVS